MTRRDASSHDAHLDWIGDDGLNLSGSRRRIVVVLRIQRCWKGARCGEGGRAQRLVGDCPNLHRTRCQHGGQTKNAADLHLGSNSAFNVVCVG
jgi:hypothetical protein